MRIGMIGAGKLGLPVAVAIAQRFPVVCYDVDPDKRRYREYEHRELGPDGGNDFQVYFKAACISEDAEKAYPSLRCPGNLRFASALEEMVQSSDIIFVAVQTPHQPQFDGSDRLPAARADFYYNHLCCACGELACHVRPEQTVAIISTVLPGAIRREIIPILGDRCKLVYSPFFIAMGTVMKDFLNPEFVLLGGGQTDDLESFYVQLYGRSETTSVPRVPVLKMSIESAELAKVAYNTYISAKIGIANTLMEIAHKTPGCNVDDVTAALGAARRRITSPAYMTAGMGDGGACHPRDNIAMSWLANKLDLSFNPFEALMGGRERQAAWLADLVACKSYRENLPIVLLGKAFKAETNITAGSAAVLVANFLKHWGWEFEHYDPYIDPEPLTYSKPRVFFIGTKHADFAKWKFPAGSVVIDPFRYIPKQDGVVIIPVGVGPEVS